MPARRPPAREAPRVGEALPCTSGERAGLRAAAATVEGRGGISAVGGVYPPWDSGDSCSAAATAGVAGSGVAGSGDAGELVVSSRLALNCSSAAAAQTGINLPDTR